MENANHSYHNCIQGSFLFLFCLYMIAIIFGHTLGIHMSIMVIQRQQECAYKGDKKEVI